MPWVVVGGARLPCGDGCCDVMAAVCAQAEKDGDSAATAACADMDLSQSQLRQRAMGCPVPDTTSGDRHRLLLTSGAIVCVAAAAGFVYAFWRKPRTTNERGRDARLGDGEETRPIISHKQPAVTSSKT